ncbi:gap-Pol poly [Brachionus plicatilis]|uniref:Gap-Pol poly n=1 Tax=Brachionus plicatilis TaxID=10195 RepID=A0A3M7R5X3_BRAPC|nr:gap-Pol poly [Brachionus plicatilis]
MSLSYKIAATNRYIKMEKSKIDFDRRFKKVNYNIGDFVLCDHPKLKKGLSQGIARKFYGPFVVVGKNYNNVDYLIRFASKPKSKIKQVHKNRLKFYFKSGLDNVKIKQESDSKNTIKNVRKKNKHVSNDIVAKHNEVLELPISSSTKKQ